MRLGDLDALKEAIKTYDTFACLPDGKLYPTRELKHPEMFVTYIHVDDVIKAIDNAPTVEEVSVIEFKEPLPPVKAQKIIRALNKRSQGDLADEVWELYEKYQSHLATHVIEFGDELKDLLGKYQKGNKEE